MPCWCSWSARSRSGTRRCARRHEEARFPRRRAGPGHYYPKEHPMKRLSIKFALLAATAAAAFGAHAADKVTVQMKWVPQAQFAGYYVAQAKGFYKDAGLDVTIKPGGPDVSPVQVIAGNQADVVVNWMPEALAAREAGVPLVNIAQVFDRSGLM